MVVTLGVRVIVLFGYLYIARPFQLNWGAANSEITARLLGDELEVNPDFLATRAITIQAKSE
jgi:hypothetical protein